MQDGVLDAADVEIDRTPVADGPGVEGPLAVPRVAVAVEVPRRVHERVHRVGLSARRAAARRAGGLDELGYLRQGRVAPPAELGHLRQLDRQVLVGHGLQAAGAAVDDGDRRAPVALPGDAPVFQPELDGRAPDAPPLGRPRHLRRGVGGGPPGELAGTDQHPRPRVSRVQAFHPARRDGIGTIGPDDDLDREAVLAREFEVPLVVGGNGHDRPRAVFGEHEVGDPDGHRPAGERVDAAAAGVETLLVDGSRQPVGAVQRPELLHLPVEPGGVGRFVGQARHQRMLGGQQHERRPEDGVDAGGEDFDLDRLAPARRALRPERLDREADQRALRAPDPVALHRQHLGGPLVEPLDAREQAVGVLGDAQEPLLKVARLDRRAAAPAPPVDHLLVRQHGRAVRTPVDRRPPPIGETALEHPQEQPLVPAVVGGLARGELALPGVADAEPLQLPLHVGDVVERPGFGVRPVLDGGVLGGQAEGVPAERVQDVEPPHPLHARDDVADHVVADVSDVGVPRRIGEHDEAVVLGAPRLFGHLEGALVGPAPPPLLFDGLRIVVGHGGQLDRDEGSDPRGTARSTRL